MNGTGPYPPVVAQPTATGSGLQPVTPGRVLTLEEARAAARLVDALHTVLTPEYVVQWLNDQAEQIEHADGPFS